MFVVTLYLHHEQSERSPGITKLLLVDNCFFISLAVFKFPRQMLLTTVLCNTKEVPNIAITAEKFLTKVNRLGQ